MDRSRKPYGCPDTKHDIWLLSSCMSRCLDTQWVPMQWMFRYLSGHLTDIQTPNWTCYWDTLQMSWIAYGCLEMDTDTKQIFRHMIKKHSVDLQPRQTSRHLPQYSAHVLIPVLTSNWISLDVPRYLADIQESVCTLGWNWDTHQET